MDRPGVIPNTGSLKSIALDVLLMLAGLAAVAAPLAASASITLVLACVLMLVGLAQILSLWQANTTLALARSVVVGCLYFFLGLVIFRHPLWSLTTLTMTIGFVFVAEGVVGAVAHFFEPEVTGLLSPIVTLVLGGMILSEWPSSSLETIGLLVGINLLVVGASRAMALGSAWAHRPHHA